MTVVCHGCKGPACVDVSRACLPRHGRVGDMWWGPERLEEDSRDYLRLLIGLFETLLTGADAVHFRALMKLFIKVRGSSFSGVLFP